MERLPWRPCQHLLAVVVASCVWLSCAQTQYFEILEYRDPTQCERMQCQSVRSEYCRDHFRGFYLKEKGCPAGQICTQCEYGNTTHATKCKCENPPFSIPVLYGQECNLGQVCTEGEGMCFRPCDTFLHITLCEKTEHCRWNTTTYMCETKPQSASLVLWSDMPAGSPFAQAQQIISDMGAALFPQGFDDFAKSARGYKLQGMLLQDIIQMESMFLQLDQNNDGVLDAGEFSRLPATLAALDTAALAQKAAAAKSSSRRLGDGVFERHLEMFEDDISDERELQMIPNLASMESTSETTTTDPGVAPSVAVRPEECGSMVPVKYFCSFDSSCKDDCKECGWKSATDSAFSQCVRPTAMTCHADGHQVFCPTDQSCHPEGDCSRCVDRPIVDHAQHLCLAVWWLDEPSTQWTNWVCRDRNKVGMPCRADQDCIYGMKRCLSAGGGQECQPLQPYNQNLTCETDFDCPHWGYYCPEDPTGGENIYWVQYCRTQKKHDETCKEDRQCVPDSLCNTAEPQIRCRRYFSLPIGTPSKSDDLCSFGWRDKHGKCAPPAKSKEAGRSCDRDSDCITTDSTGRSGRCRCKAWWDKDDSKYCEPVTGDYKDHWASRRDWISFRWGTCGNNWSEEECMKVYGQEATSRKLKMLCETQQLSGGPYLPPPDCNVVDMRKFPDYCQMERMAGSLSMLEVRSLANTHLY